MRARQTNSQYHQMFGTSFAADDELDRDRLLVTAVAFLVCSGDGTKTSSHTVGNEQEHDHDTCKLHGTSADPAPAHAPAPAANDDHDKDDDHDEGE